MIEFLFKRGYKEFEAPVNHTNLRVSVNYAKKLAILNGLKVAGKFVSHKSVPDGVMKFGGQSGLLLV